MPKENPDFRIDRSQEHGRNDFQRYDDLPVYGDGLFPSLTDQMRREKKAEEGPVVGTLVSSCPPRIKPQATDNK